MALSFLVTGRCTLRCEHCFYHRSRPSASEELTVDEYAKLSRSLDDFLVALFCGGEPFMRGDLAEIVNLFRANNSVPFAGAATNGQLTLSILRQTEEILIADRHKPFTLALSVDGFRDVHDRMRGAGSFERAMRTWRELRALARRHSNLVLATTTVVSSLNQDSVKDFLRWVSREMRPEAASVLLIRQSPRAGDFLKRVEPRCYLEAQNAALECNSRSFLLGARRPQAVFMSTIGDLVHETMLTGKRAFHCYAGIHGGVIDFRGDVHACEVLAEVPGCGSIGNLRDHDMSFPAVWNSDRADEMRRLVNEHGACASCTHETMGYLPSLFFSPNRLGYVLGERPPRPRRRVTGVLRELVRGLAWTGSEVTA